MLARGRVESLNNGVPSSFSCPLCGAAEHEGRCERYSTTLHWCGKCLVTKLTPADLEGPRLPADVLRAVNVNRTTVFCRHCAIPVCSEHSRSSKTKNPRKMVALRKVKRCIDDCSNLTPAQEKTYVLTLDKYVPTWRTAGPRRCEVCNLPVFMRTLCRRHHEQLKRGSKKKMVPQRFRRPRAGPTKLVAVYLLKPVAEAVGRITYEEGVTMTAFMEGLVQAELRRRFLALKRRAAAAPALT